jgi:myo-inositol-1(or 4)-monophosphatase
MNLDNICEKVCELARSTGGFLRDEKSKITLDNIEIKGSHDFVTYVDKTSEKILVEGLQKLLPEVGFLVEEKTVNNDQKDFTWIIDPLDGTTNYIHGFDPYAISIALENKNEIILGVVYVVSTDECFYAWKDSKAFLNGKEIRVSSRKTIEDSLIATGFPYYDFKRIEPFMKTLEYFFQESHGIRRLGSAATDLVYVACGRFEAFYEYSLSPWDVAAGALIVERAGGKVSDFKGGNNYLYGKEILSANNLVFSEFLDIIKRFMDVK